MNRKEKKPDFATYQSMRDEAVGIMKENQIFEDKFKLISGAAIWLSLLWLVSGLKVYDPLLFGLLMSMVLLSSAAITCVVLSMISSQIAFQNHMKNIEKLYIDRDDAYQNKRSVFDKMTVSFNLSSAILLIFAIINGYFVFDRMFFLILIGE
jgi:hypothetical protein